MPHRPCSQLVVLLIRPSKYDDDGYVVRHWRGVLPSNTLNCLYSLTQDAIRTRALGDLRIRVHALDEAVDRVVPRRLARKHLRPGVRAVVALAGVQTNQFPRAQDLARQFKAEGFDVMIGGFHVSGAIAMAQTMPPECQAMLDAGVTLVLGEVEGRWPALLRDAAAGTLHPLYDFLDQPPDLAQAPIPMPSSRLQRKFAVRHSGTIDVSRGCPFRCSFCTIISVQGRTMRARDAQCVLSRIRENAQDAPRHRIDHYFFTDDNFSRNPAWEAIFDGLIALRAEGIRVDFMMQVDIAAWRIPRFVDKAAQAGCVQVFIGMESIREDNLASVGKRQNRVDKYRAAITSWHDAGVVCHVGYIIGFPHDTYTRVLEDVRALREILTVDQASFFLLTPLPGSQDHCTAVASNETLECDYNAYDSFHVTRPHPHMSHDELMRAFHDAWREFYTLEHMEQALLRQNPHTYWGLFKVFLWYRAAMREGAHPMITGFIRLKDRRARRPHLPLEPRWRFRRQRLGELSRQVLGYLWIALEMQELWLRTRIRRRDYARWLDVRGFVTRATTPSSIKMQWGALHAELAARVRAVRDGTWQPPNAGAMLWRRLEAIRDALGTVSDVPSATVGNASNSASTMNGAPPHAMLTLRDGRTWRLPRAVKPFHVSGMESQQGLTSYWRDTWARLRRFELWRINPVRLAWRLACDTRNALVFLAAAWMERY